MQAHEQSPFFRHLTRTTGLASVNSPDGQLGPRAVYIPGQHCVHPQGDLAIDNNAAENALRRVAVDRKNWLFAGSDNGGHSAAVLFSLIATCQRHKLDPFRYLRNVLTRIAATPVSQLPQPLPDRGKAATHPMS